jgi:HAMP domain-containing protein
MVYSPLLRKALPGILVLTVLAVLVLSYLLFLRQEAREQTLKNYLAVDVHETLQDRSTKIAHILSAVYENARMVSLLPGVRSITASNRKSDTEDAVAKGQFSQHDYEVVQQIYNNLASAVNVSEIYIVLDGFDAQQGDVPFLMLDQLIIGINHDDGVEEEHQSSDIPDESEAEEYAYYPVQLNKLRAMHPTFGFTKLEQIPMVASPIVRTCDNTQYPSISQGDVRNAGGILFSVPIYNNQNQFIGLVSVIVRSNVLEAALLDVPFLLVTQEDRQQAAQEKWTMPAQSSLLLSNVDYGVHIFDRRNAVFDSRLGVQKTNALFEQSMSQSVTVKSPYGTEWTLRYHIDPEKLNFLEQQSDKKFFLPLLFFFFVYTVMLVVVVLTAKSRLFQERLGQLLFALRQLATKNFDAEIPYQKASGEVGNIAQALVTMKNTALQVLEHAKAQTLLAAVAEALQSAQTLQEFGNSLGRVLHQNIAFDYLALYVVTQDGSKLVRCGGIACEDPERGSCFGMGEGLVGQVAMQGRELQISEQQGHHLQLKTGLLRIPVQSIRVIPVAKANRVFAVLEVAAIQPLSSAENVMISEVVRTLVDKLELLLNRISSHQL